MSKSTFLSLLSSLFLFCSSFNLFAQSTCTTPPTLLVAGKSINVVQYSGGPISFMRASDFDAGSYSNCGNLVAFSFSSNVNDTLQGLDCFRIGTNTVTIFLTDTEGNQAMAIAYVIVQDYFGLCNNPSTTSCPNEFVLHNGLTTALSNSGTALIHTTDFIERIGENCTGAPVTKFEDTGDETKTFTSSEMGTNFITIQLEVNGTAVNNVGTFILVQNALSTTACIPVPIIRNGFNAVLNPSGTATIFANAFDIASYSDCGGMIKLSYSSNVNDTVKVLNAGNVGTEFTEIWITDLQTGTQNMVQAYIQLQDLLPPICATLPMIVDTCYKYQPGTLGASTDMDGDGAFDDVEYTALTGPLLSVYNNSFGAPACSDNTDGVASLSIEQEYQLVETACAILIRRRYRALDIAGNTSNWTVQEIEYFNFPDWQITFPANYQGGCTDVFPTAAVDIQAGNCHTFSTVTEDTAGVDVFYRTKRTFYITNECHNFAGKDTLVILNSAAGVQINSEGNENVGCIIYVQYLDIIDENQPILEITSPDPCISGIDFDAAPFNEEDISPGSAPYECDQIKTWSTQAVDNCDAALDIVGKIMIQGNTVLEFQGASVSYIVSPNTTYTIQFTATDDYGNVGFSNQQYTFFDCVQPTIQLQGNKSYTLPASGSVDISVFEFDYASFDNCTDQSKLDFRIWHASLGGTAPTSLADVQALPTSITFNQSHVGTNLLTVYVIDESGNWSYGETFAILNDANNCNTTPFTLPVTINNFSDVGEDLKIWTATTNYAVNPVSWIGKLYEDEVLVAEVDTNAVIYTTVSNKAYKVEFIATDVCGNTGMDTLTQNFSDCDQAPYVRLTNNLVFNMNANGTVNILPFLLNNGSFDNCTPADKFAGRVWHGVLGVFPQNITAVNGLPQILSLDCSSIGVQEVHLFIIDEQGNYASAATSIIIQDNNGVCFFPPPPNPCSETPLNITGSLSTDSTYQAVETITSTATIATNTTITFQAGQSVTLNAGFHAVVGSAFTAKIETCTNTQTLIETPTSEEKPVEAAKIAVNPSRPMPIEQGGMALNIYPNPFRGATTVDYFIPEIGSTTIQLRDFLGRKMATLVNNEHKEEGWHQLELNVANIPSGTYYLIIANQGQLKASKLVLLK